MQSLVNQFWQALSDSNEELNSFISGGLPGAVEKRHKNFIKRWDNMKDKAETLVNEIEQQSSLSVDPIETKLPWSSEAFKNAWQLWKDYLIEQHNKRMRVSAVCYGRRLSSFLQGYKQELRIPNSYRS